MLPDFWSVLGHCYKFTIGSHIKVLQIGQNYCGTIFATQYIHCRPTFICILTEVADLLNHTTAKTLAMRRDRRASRNRNISISIRSVIVSSRIVRRIVVKWRPINYSTVNGCVGAARRLLRIVPRTHMTAAGPSSHDYVTLLMATCIHDRCSSADGSPMPPQSIASKATNCRNFHGQVNSLILRFNLTRLGQMQRDRATRLKYEISHLKGLAIGNNLQRHSRSLQLLLLDRPCTCITFCYWPVVTTSPSSTISEMLSVFQCMW